MQTKFLLNIIALSTLALCLACAETGTGIGSGAETSTGDSIDGQDSADTNNTDDQESDTTGASDNDENTDSSNGPSTDPGGNNSDNSTPDSNDPGSTPDGPDSNTDTSNPEDDCESFEFSMKPDEASIARVMLVVDRSYSMVNTVDRWTPMVEALGNITDTLDGLVDFGLMVFPNPAAQNECAEGEVQITPASGQSDNINLVLSVHVPDQQYGGTPTALSLEEAGRALLEANPGSDNNYILLATDGGPGCNYDLDYMNCECLSEWCWEMPANCLDDARTVSTVLNLNLQGIQTFVVGIPGSEDFGAVLDQMAVAGGTAVDGGHYAVSNDIELGDALSTTTGGLVPCSYHLQEPVDDIESLIVRIDGIVIQRDVTHQNGWDLVNGYLELYGTACSSLRDGQPHSVRALYDCEES